MKNDSPAWLMPEPWRENIQQTSKNAVETAISADMPGIKEFAAMLSPAADQLIEHIARRARALTQRHFGKTISLYVPLYLSNYCSSGCLYCGFASDRNQPRRKLEKADLLDEIRALKEEGFEDVLLLTGERSPEAGFDYLLKSARIAAKHFHNVTVESFAMTVDEYRRLGDAGCSGITLYQETYDPFRYVKLHPYGRKSDYRFRIEAPERALTAGLRAVGLGALLGLSDPFLDALSLFQHIEHLRKRFWRAGILVSFPRICPEQGGYLPEHPVSGAYLARMIFAFRICFPDMPLVLSTRERPEFRDGIAGIGISRMSAASKTTVGGYAHAGESSGSQFHVHDSRDARSVCEALRKKGLDPVFKNWDSVFR